MTTSEHLQEIYLLLYNYGEPEQSERMTKFREIIERQKKIDKLKETFLRLDLGGSQ